MKTDQQFKWSQQNPRGRGAGFLLSAQGGFSVLEILVAMAVLALLVLMSAKVFDMTSTAWRVQERQSDTITAARVALDFMAREMTSVMVANNDNRKGTLTMCYKHGALPTDPLGNDGTTDADRFDDNSFADQVYFVAPVAPTDRHTDLAEVGYYLSYDTSTKAYQLRRRFVTTTDTDWNIWTMSGAVLTPNTVWFNTPTPGGASVAATTPLNATATNAVTLAFNIWSLKVECTGNYGYEGTNSFTEYPVANPNRYIWDGAAPYSAGSGSTNGTLPTAVRIAIKVFDQRTAEKVKNYQSWGSPAPSASVEARANAKWWDVVKQGSFEFATWVYLPTSGNNIY